MKLRDLKMKFRPLMNMVSSQQSAQAVFLLRKLPKGQNDNPLR